MKPLLAVIVFVVIILGVVGYWYCVTEKPRDWEK